MGRHLRVLNVGTRAVPTFSHGRFGLLSSDRVLIECSLEAHHTSRSRVNNIEDLHRTHQVAEYYQSSSNPEHDIYIIYIICHQPEAQGASNKKG